MKIFENEYIHENDKGCVLAFGNFDGVHLGHRHLLDKAKEYANKEGLLFGVYTFVDSPKFKDPCHSNLLTLQGRLSMLHAFCDPDFVYLEKFDDVRNFTPSEFVSYVVEKFGCECAFCGENFSFGRFAAGKSFNLLSLMKSCGKNAVIVDSLKNGEVTISSSIIRSFVEKGDCENTERFLGYSYHFTSKVVHGNHIGHSLGFPTINQIIPNALVCPAYGVYSTVVIIDGREYMGVTNFGTKPTVSNDNTPVAETYIIDFDGDVYDKYVGLAFLKYLRCEMKFESLDELKENIKKNVFETKQFFKEKHENN